MNPGITIKIGPTIEYQKPGKFHTVKFVIGAGPEIPNNGDHYKSGTVSVKQGLPASSKILKDQEGFLVKLIIVNITIEEQQENCCCRTGYTKV